MLGWECEERARLGRPPVDETGTEDVLWIGELSAAMAGVVAATGGEPVLVPDDLSPIVAEALARILPGAVHRLGAAVEGAVIDLVGPGRPEGRHDRLIALVPRTDDGERWPTADGFVAVPLEAEVWAYLAHDQRATARSLIHARWGARGLAGEVHRDDPPPAVAPGPVRLDRAVFLTALLRLPESEEPWLRSLHKSHGDPYRWAL